MQDEICQDCGGRKGAGGLNPSSSMSLNIKKPVKYDDYAANRSEQRCSDEDDGSLNRDDSSLELQSEGASSLDIGQFLNTPYLQMMYCPEEVLEWVVHNRARKIQWAFLERLQVKVKAVRTINRFWKRYLHCRHDKDFRKLLIQNSRKKAAVRRISAAYREMKVNKVYNAQQIMQEKGILVP